MLTTNKRKFPKGIKGVMAERSYLFLEIVLINKENIIDVCTVEFEYKDNCPLSWAISVRCFFLRPGSAPIDILLVDTL